MLNDSLHYVEMKNDTFETSDSQFKFFIQSFIKVEFGFENSKWMEKREKLNMFHGSRKLKQRTVFHVFFCCENIPEQIIFALIIKLNLWGRDVNEISRDIVDNKWDFELFPNEINSEPVTDFHRLTLKQSIDWMWLESRSKRHFQWDENSFQSPDTFSTIALNH